MRKLIFDRIEWWLNYYKVTKEDLRRSENAEGINRFKRLTPEYESLSDEELVKWFESFIIKCSKQM